MYDFHKPLRAAPPEVIMMLRGAHKASKDQRKSACIIFYPRRARTEELFLVLYQLQTFPQVVHPFPGIAI